MNANERMEVVSDLRQMADAETNGSPRWWILARAAELLEDDPRYTVTDAGRAMLKDGE